MKTLLSTCAKCRAKKYCCKSCQKNDWKKHKLECVAPAGNVVAGGEKIEAGKEVTGAEKAAAKAMSKPSIEDVLQGLVVEDVD